MTISERWDIVKHNFKQLLISIDQVMNVLNRFFTEKKYADETISSRAYRFRRDENKPFYEKVINKIFFWEKDHCYESYMSEMNRLQLPPEFRNK